MHFLLTKAFAFRTLVSASVFVQTTLMKLLRMTHLESRNYNRTHLHYVLGKKEVIVELSKFVLPNLLKRLVRYLTDTWAFTVSIARMFFSAGMMV